MIQGKFVGSANGGQEHSMCTEPSNFEKRKELNMSEPERSEKADAVQAGSPEKQESEPPDADRREAVKKLGAFAACTAPAMLAVLLPKQSLGGPSEH